MAAAKPFKCTCASPTTLILVAHVHLGGGLARRAKAARRAVGGAAERPTPAWAARRRWVLGAPSNGHFVQHFCDVSGEGNDEVRSIRAAIFIFLDESLAGGAKRSPGKHMYRPAPKCPAFVKRCIQRRRREGEHPKQQWGLKSRRRQRFLPSRASVCLCVNSHTPQPAVGHARNPSAKYYHYIHILGLPRRDSPSRNRGPNELY